MYLIFIVIILYGFLILSYRFGWDSNSSADIIDSNLKVSVIVAVKNEEKHIKRLYKNIYSQNYPKDMFEILFINDHSTDSTEDLLKEIKSNNVRYLNMSTGVYGKKNSIKKAIDTANGDVIIITDADCTFSLDWMKTIVSCFSDDNIKLVSGPVSYKNKSGLFNAFQSLEFMSLVGSGAGSIGCKRAILCNGANMAYRKDIFLELNTYESDNCVSGDDVFLLHQVKAKYPKGILFIKDSRAIVETMPSAGYKEFYNQRKRWTAKSTNYNDVSTIYVSLLILLVNFLVLLLFFLLFYDHSLSIYFVIFFISKFIIDILFLRPVLKFFKRNDLIPFIFPFEIFYSFYIVFIVVLSFTNSFQWKDRTYNK